MAEQTYADYKLTRTQSPAGPETEVPAVSPPLPSAESQESPPAPVPPGEEEDEEEETPQVQARNRRLENRFKRLTDRLRAKDRELAELRGELTAVMHIVKPPITAPPTGPQRPTRETYPDDDAYFEAVADWKAEEKVQAALAKERATMAATHATQTHVAESFQARLDAAKQQYTDYDEVVGESDVVVSTPVADAIQESEQGAALIYYLAQHPDEAAALNQLGPVALGRRLATLEASLPPAPSSQRSQTPPVTPPPITPVPTGTPPATTSVVEGMSYRDWRAGRISGRIR